MRIPPGNPRTNSTVPHHLFDEKAPVMQYVQGTRKTCVTDSLASSLFHLNYEILAEHIHQIGISRNEEENHSINMVPFVRDYLMKKENEDIFIID